MQGKALMGVAGALLLAIVVYASLFVVKEQELALKLRLGEIVTTEYEPGLHFKVPVVQNVILFDKRIQTLDSQPQRFLTVEKKFVVVDSYVKWRINDAAQYYRSTQGNMGTTARLLIERTNAGLRDAFGRRTIQEVVSGERGEIMDKIAKLADEKASDLGVEIVDVRVKKIDFPPEVSNRVYERMRTERERVARELRAQGEEAAERIRADADRQRTEILATAYKEAELIRGEGDAKAAQIYANAFDQNAEFYGFWRSLNAYRNVFDGGDSVMVLNPDSEFFRYFRRQDGGG